MTTDKQRKRAEDTYTYIRERWENENTVPTQKEIAAHLGVAVATVRDALSLLQAQGRIEREPYKARSIRLVEGPPPVDGTVEMVYAYIRGKFADGNVPTQSEIAFDCYLSRREVKRCLTWLETQGRIIQGEGQRGIRLPPSE